MAPSKRTGKLSKAAAPGKSVNGAPPAPFKKPPEVLKAFIAGLSEKHVYITHIDAKPAAFKRKLFLVPIAMNISVAALFLLRMWWILPWYWSLTLSFLGYPNETSFNNEDATWSELFWEIGTRGLTMFVDFLFFVFVWPWPVEFVAGQAHGNPTRWRWNVGFRDKEIYVRRSRPDWDQVLGDIFKDEDTRKILFAYIRAATSPLLQEQKTGYLLMNAQWDLDWNSMVHAHALVDKKDIALDAFKNIVLVHHQDYGWLCYDLKGVAEAGEDDKRRQVFAFRDALTAMGKEDLFYRWVEMVQYEATQPGGFGPDEQEAAAKRIRDMFEEQGIDFDGVWKDAVGEDGTGI